MIVKELEAVKKKAMSRQPKDFLEEQKKEKPLPKIAVAIVDAGDGTGV